MSASVWTPFRCSASNFELNQMKLVFTMTSVNKKKIDLSTPAANANLSFVCPLKAVIKRYVVYQDGNFQSRVAVYIKCHLFPFGAKT